MFEQQLGRSVTIDQAAELLQVSRRTIYNRIRDGKLLTIRTLGGSQRVLVSSVEENRKVKFVFGGRAEPVHTPQQTSLPPSPFAIRNSK
jgi:excisionase family DNA binding protein